MPKGNLTGVFVSLRPNLERAVRGIVPPREVEDIVQETYVRACQAEHRQEIKAPRSFLYKTARNLALDYVKRAETRLTVSYTEESRLVTLERGEIHVQVSHDPGRRFSVIANDHVVQAVGTEFNVEITNDQRIELLVTDGIVIVGILEGTASGDNPNSPSILPPSAVSVSAGQEIILGSSEEELRTVASEEIEVKLSWTEGNLIFRGESLEAAITEISRYTSVEFRFLDEDSKRVRVVGLFQTGDVDGLLAALRENFNISYERIDDDTILLSASP